MPASPTATPEHIKDVNTRYHDAAAEEYDAKWGIDFGAIGQRQVRLKLVKALGGLDGRAFGDGAGDRLGHRLLLAQPASSSGSIERLTATDISPGMLKRLAGDRRRARRSRSSTVATEAEELPFEDESFDLVFGHAVLHHIPDLDRAFAEFRRVLRPGGAIAFAGEPSRYGDRLAALPKRAGLLAAPAWRRAVGARPRAVAEAEQSHGHALEGEVDVHAFAPADLRRLLRDAGFEQRRVGGEELLANAWGWGLRTVESSAEPESVSWGWRHFAFNSYIALQKVDTAPARAPPPGRALLQPARLRPQAGLTHHSLGSELSIRSRPSRTPARTPSRIRSFVARWASRFSCPELGGGGERRRIEILAADQPVEETRLHGLLGVEQGAGDGAAVEVRARQAVAGDRDPEPGDREADRDLVEADPEVTRDPDPDVAAEQHEGRHRDRVPIAGGDGGIGKGEQPLGEPGAGAEHLDRVLGQGFEVEPGREDLLAAGDQDDRAVLLGAVERRRDLPQHRRREGVDLAVVEDDGRDAVGEGVGDQAHPDTSRFARGAKNQICMLARSALKGRRAYRGARQHAGRGTA